MLEPFLKWPGGKRWLTRQYASLFPTEYKRYFEPFLGGAAVFFHLTPRCALLSDTNKELINVYKCLKAHAPTIDRRLWELQRRHSSKMYYRTRAARPVDPIERAVRFLYLNRTCFNGIYRVNRKGDFNVPVGSKSLVAYPGGYLQNVAASLRSASIRESDFEAAIDRAGSGDFIFADPPYTVMHNNNNFLKYNSNLFSWPDQVKLAAALKRAAVRGAAFMVSNADHGSVRDLYAKFGTLHRVNRSSVLAADPLRRRRTTELLITNY
ncbi:MAG TPA: Dam family site-specific DNA-(adenine-N6)-methyltransferase [Terriglobia bacterium]|nr:Dam family site-specific DNA-(adenine-N6)-methyltransferase [Terriglobia bacterium]